MLILTLIRHGESSDNVKSVWAGWKDAGLTNHGETKALGKWFVENGNTFDAIISSTLMRADATAQAIYDRHPTPKPFLLKNPLLREQHFGIAEGQLYVRHKLPGLSLEECYAQSVFPHPRKRNERFPGGESKEELAKRAECAINEIILQYVHQAVDEDVRVAVVSHGLFIREMVDILMKMDITNSTIVYEYKGLRNTGWTRMTIKAREMRDTEPTQLRVRITDSNRHEHLNSITRQQGGIGRMAYDSTQKDIRSFFGGRP
ncbi:phosphoglycerate mutase-like protein [Marasmius fiardii PR-910]|nr:phosphoglycerate mutase-like protein [Marasmius fiardii PR-910]